MQTDLPRPLSIFEYSPSDGAVAGPGGESKSLRAQNNIRTALFLETFSLMVVKAK